jgi:hypothetical protein
MSAGWLVPVTTMRAHRELSPNAGSGPRLRDARVGPNSVTNGHQVAVIMRCDIGRRCRLRLPGQDDRLQVGPYDAGSRFEYVE